MKRSFLAAGFLAILLLSGCAATRNQPKVDPNASLYERLGGKPVIEAVVKEFNHNIGADERINGFFIGADPAKLERLLVEQICQATGGPCKYTGRDMVTTHHGMNITEAQFNALVEDLIKALNTFQVPEREQKELLGALAAMKGQIINH